MPKTIHDRHVSADEIAAALPTETCNVGRYRHDRRVVQDDTGGVYVTRAMTVWYHVVHEGMAGWCIRDPLGDVIEAPGGRFATDYPTVDAAIFALIGAPKS